MRLTIKTAATAAEVHQSRELIASVYGQHYQTVFSDDELDPERRIEPFPDRFAMGLVDGELVAACGLYTGHTYVERLGKVTPREVQAQLAAAGLSGQYDPADCREYTKLVVKPGWGGTGVGRFFLAATHSRDFLQVGSDGTHMLLACAKLSIFDRIYARIGIHTRTIKPFPFYEVHRGYRSADDPMESRLIVSDRDIPPQWYELSLPGTYEVLDPGQQVARAS